MESQQFTENILYPSLKLIRDDNRLKRFYFLPGLMSVIFLSVMLVYQVVYTYVVLLEKTDQAFLSLLSLFHSEHISLWLIFGWIFIVAYILLTPIFDGALIKYIETRDNKWAGQASRSDAFGYGMVRFYAMFEYNNIFNMFKLFSILNGFLFVLRFLWIEYLGILWAVFSILLLLSFILNMFISYAQYEIVLEKNGVFESIGVSSQIALLNIKTTLRLYTLMFIMNIRVMINFVTFLVFPLLAVSIGGWISSQFFAFLAYIILGGTFVILILFLGYMAAVMDIFSTAMWYYAYKEGRKKIADLDGAK